jgi:hypothetical protein
MRPGPGHVIGTAVWGVATGYFDGDQMLDLAVTRGDETTTGTVGELKGRRRGGFQTLNYYPVDVQPIYVAASDLNGGGRPDLAVANRRGNTVSVLLNLGDGPGADGRHAAGRVAVDVAFPADVADGLSSPHAPAPTATATVLPPALSTRDQMEAPLPPGAGHTPTPTFWSRPSRPAVKGSLPTGGASVPGLGQGTADFRDR